MYADLPVAMIFLIKLLLSRNFLMEELYIFEFINIPKVKGKRYGLTGFKNKSGILVIIIPKHRNSQIEFGYLFEINWIIGKIRYNKMIHE